MSWDEIADLSKNDKRFIAACHAMTVMMKMAGPQFIYVDGIPKDCAQWASKYADALIAELDNK